jgi:Zn-dependent M28 family amino/carboxypeptidase
MQDEKVSPWKTVVRYGTQPRMSWVHPDGRTYTLAPGVVASASLDTPAAELLFAGAPQSFQQLRAAADRPKARLKGFALPTRARIERATAFKDVTSPNVAAMLEGSDPKLRNEVVVLMAHLDHLGVRPKNEGDKIYNGAMDNAAGIATMLEVARAVAAERPKRSVLFLAVTAEEKGLLGADFFAHYPTVPLERVVGLVNLDMPILTYSFTDVIAFGAEHSTLGQAVASAAGKVGVKLSPDPMPEEGIFTRSDHYAFVKKGVPSVFFATGWANGGEKVWKDFLANKYHQPNDDLNLPINWQAGARFARINYLLTREIADAPGRPRWYRGNFFGETFAPGAEKAARAGK